MRRSWCCRRWHWRSIARWQSWWVTSPPSSPEWLMIRELLENRSERGPQARAPRADRIVRHARRRDAACHQRIALMGLRGAGKSTLGQMLADDLDFPFVELSREIERSPAARSARCTTCTAPGGLPPIRAACDRGGDPVSPPVVIATPGGHRVGCRNVQRTAGALHFVWLQADPKITCIVWPRRATCGRWLQAQEAMDDLNRILAGRLPFYSKAELESRHQRDSPGQDISGATPAGTRALPIQPYAPHA